MGSVAFTACPRFVLQTVQTDDGGRAVVWSKITNGRPGSGFNYSIESASVDAGDGGPLLETNRVSWGGQIEQSVLGPARQKIKSTDAADDFLRRAMENGPRPQAEVVNAAAAAGINYSALNRACQRLRIASRRQDDEAGRHYYEWFSPE